MKKVLSALVLGAAMTTGAFAGYPSKTIKLVVPSKAGGSTDTTARLFIDTAKKYWKDINQYLVTLGQLICRPMKHECKNCPANKLCSHAFKPVKR